MVRFHNQIFGIIYIKINCKSIAAVDWLIILRSNPDTHTGWHQKGVCAIYQKKYAYYSRFKVIDRIFYFRYY